jgi:hypothetical protein
MGLLGSRFSIILMYKPTPVDLAERYAGRKSNRAVGAGPNLLDHLVGFGQKAASIGLLVLTTATRCGTHFVGPAGTGTLGGIEWGMATGGNRIYTEIADSGHANYRRAIRMKPPERMSSLPLRRFRPLVLAGEGALIFDPIDFPGAGSQTRAAFLYGSGADFSISRHVIMRAEYRGFVYNSPTYK